MLQAFTRNYNDNSTDAGFQFTFYCDICGKPWHSVPYLSGLTGENDPRARESERVAAYERANREALNWFSRCPVCKRVVCDECFCILGEENMCVSCAQG